MKITAGIEPLDDAIRALKAAFDEYKSYSEYLQHGIPDSLALHLTITEGTAHCVLEYVTLTGAVIQIGQTESI